jgi:3-oxoacyl-[acyl-carrier-protein] synthase I
MAANGLQILGLGASTPVGRDVWSSAAAVRAGVCGFSEHPFMVDSAGEPMRIARAPWLDVALDGAERQEQLLTPVINEALRFPTFARAPSSVRMGLVLAMSPSRPGRSQNLAADLLDRLTAHDPGRFKSMQVFEVGHAGGHLALHAAASAFASNALDTCVVCGIDSYLAPETLEWVDACDQLHGGGPLNNAWGFVPGEAAGALLVGTPEFVHETGVEPLAELVGQGIGKEAQLIKTDAVCRGEGLTQAFREALEGLTFGETVHNVYCDLNGEPYRADEYGFTALRTGQYFRAPSDFVAPADCWGDVGAAGVPLHFALAMISHRKRYSKGPISLVWASSESGERGAALVRAFVSGEG